MIFKKFDSLFRYRVATVILTAAFVLFRLTQDPSIVHPIGRWIFAAGLAVLWISLVWDVWQVYTGRRKVKQMIDKKLKPHQKK